MTISLADLLSGGEMILVCGSGGVGKTTLSASLAIAAATQNDRRVLVVTVDPARRLAQTLGLTGFGNEAVLIDTDKLTSSRGKPVGRLWAEMVDTKASWDELIRRYAPSDDIRDRVLANPLYRNLTERFVHSHDYIAMERLYDMRTSGNYDLVIVDTPPSRNALDILDAPRRMLEFFDSRLLNLLTIPYRSKLIAALSRPFYQVADRILGARFLQDIGEFFTLFRTMEDGFVKRATEIERELSARQTSFIVVSTLESTPLREAEFLAQELHRRQFSLAGLIVNRILPSHIVDCNMDGAADRLRVIASNKNQVSSLRATLHERGCNVDDRQLIRVLGIVANEAGALAVAGRREGDALSKVQLFCETLDVSMWESPMLSSDAVDVLDLMNIAEHLQGV
jgi:anion-transporting  ArsA/GET3 family ATPase